MDSRTTLALVLLAGAGLYLWSTQADASAGGDSSGSDAGLSDSLSTDLGNLLGFGSGGTVSDDSTIDDSWADDIGLGLGDSFGDGSDGSTIGDSSGGSMGTGGSNGWQVNQYPTYAARIAAIESQFGIPSGLLGAQLYAESSYDPAVIAGYTRSSTGAIGIAQFEPQTADDYGLVLVSSSYNGTPTKTYDPNQSIGAAGKYLAKNYAQFGDWATALMAYEAGPTYIAGWLKRGSNTSETNVQAALAYADKITSFVPVG